MSEKTTDKTFHQLACDYIHDEVTVITSQATFEGKLLSVGKDVIILQNHRLGGRSIKLIIRIEEIVALYRDEPKQVGPFGFIPTELSFEEFEQGSENN